MKDTGRRKKVVGQLFDPVPGHSIFLTSSSERAPPKVDDMVTEYMERTTVRRHRMICKEAGYDLPQPFPLFGDWLMPTPSHLVFDFLELHPHPVTSGFALQREPPMS
jgi:hypothetical protein